VKRSPSLGFDLPLAALTLVVEGGWQEEDVHRAFDAQRAADLVALPNIRTADARVAEERLREAIPKANAGVAP
jgi:hypothetical protein